MPGSSTVTEADLESALHRAEACLDKTSDVGEAEDFRLARRELFKVVRELPGRADRDPEGLAREAILLYARTWYQDQEVHAWRGLDEAWRTISAHFDLRKVVDPEVLGVVGLIHRRRWMLSGQVRDLRRALVYYELGFRRGEVADRNTVFNGFVAALLMVELSRLEERALYYLQEPSDYSARIPPIDELETDPAFRQVLSELTTQTASELRQDARQVRLEVVARLEAMGVADSDDWELHAAHAGALFGLRRYVEALTAAEDAARRPQRSERDLQHWAHEFVLMARQRGIRPEAEAIKQASEHEEWVKRLNVARRFDGQDRALAMRLDGASFESIAEALGYEDASIARYAVLNEEQYHVLSIVRAFLRAADDSIDEDMVLSAFTGKVGLALSGGGFRAALYHVGVLAALADLNVLRHVQVISCVSGGSIVGAHYYMLVKELLEQKPDDDIDSRDLVEVVGKLCDGMMTAVDRNLRARIFTNIFDNFRMLATYSPSQRLGDLLTRHALPQVYDHTLRQRGGSLRVARLPTTQLRQLAINPRRDSADGIDHDFGFKPKRHNWRRAVKVPVLILNATALNTGHNWQFTARHMGEPPAIIHPEIDANPRLRRVFFKVERGRGRARRAVDAVAKPVRRRWGHDELDRRFDPVPEARQEELVRLSQPDVQEDAPPISIGRAVAASAAVPGIFEPLALGDGYPPMLVKLSDGGVVDNQGVTGLLEQECDILLVSDASGQLVARNRPAGGLFPALRSSLIASQRIRAAQYEELKMLRRSQLIRDFLFVHLNQELDSSPIGWRGVDKEERDRTRARSRTTSYGVDREVQTALARLRTDLDTFSEAEAYALMTSGYLATRCSAMKDGVGPFRPGSGQECVEPSPEQRERWRFLQVEPLMGGAGADQPRRRLVEHLGRGSRRMLRSVPTGSKPLDPDLADRTDAKKRALKAAAIPIVLVALLVLAWNATDPLGLRVGTPRQILLALLVIALAVALVGLRHGRMVGPLEIIWKVFLLIVSMAWFVVAWVYLLGRKVFPRSGSLSRLNRGEAGPGPSA